MIAGAIGHVLTPEIYSVMIPSFIPEDFANVSAAIIEALIGITLFIPSTRNRAGLGFLILMLAFLPIHIWDAFQDLPAVGSTWIALFRIVIQFLLIYTGWWIYKLPSTRQDVQ
jgi:uncharacterized membrane protein